ncbi:MAG: 30S ribosomal protein S3 [Gammaproteobacteria bacterium]|nr:30S ribosomal protein S3 [Gammaproteobacteria bacterium]MCP4089132.1 30S ribosomal protein S3 [Gammaproteobacteria bacterium]MCP4276844.1 30S ribosomal protein S3 [Gammaproteobacteria bacterium]MCP4830687.1 30S ribosomal protein S3 [Gammaproteobacteria bacterium]MCP4928496.1 30S ribosomal protein S3 [Gammaproteobacteria bacterium]
MGQKVHPIGIRLGITRDWTSTWYADSKQYSKYVFEDFQVRAFLRKQLKEASVSRIQIERPARKASITVHTARPGIVIGKKGEDIEKLRAEICKMINLPLQDVRLNISEIRKPELDAQLVAEGIAQQLERRVMFRRAMKRAVTNTMRLGAEGIKVKVGGRLNGAEIARSEWYREGRVPLHTFRADIDYGFSEAMTTYGIIGVKVWIFRGEVIGGQQEVIKPAAEQAGR